MKERMTGWRSTIVLIGLASLTVSAVPSDAETPDGGVGNVEFEVSGQLEEFPCPEGCLTTFDGTGDGAGNVPAMIDGVAHNATFTIVRGTVTGSAEYSEPGFPFCPVVGSAASPTTGSVTLSGGATGVVFRTDPLLPIGTVFAATTTLDFTYTRVGATPAIEITGGSTTVEYFIPGSGPDSFTQELVAGAGGGVFEVDPVDAVLLCQNPGPLDFTVVGDAVVAS